MKPDSELIEAARRGEIAALNALLAQCHPDAKRFARALCATPEDAEDAVQETLWLVSRKIGSLRTAAAFTAWLFRVVKHECFRLLKFQRRAQSVSLEAASEARLAADPPQLQAAVLQELVTAIAALPPIYRRVLVMRDVEERPAAEVAERLGLSVAAVKSRLHRARHLVRTSLRPWVD